MKVNYRKEKSDRLKLVIYISTAFLIIILNLILIGLEIYTNEVNLLLLSMIITTVLSCLASLYSIFQDIYLIHKKPRQKFIFQTSENGIPFINREELLNEVISELFEKLDNNYYITKNIQYKQKNGKKSFSKKLCLELQKIKDKEKDSIKLTVPKLANKIGNIYYVDYANYMESFSTRIKCEFTYVSGKKNIVVVNNSCSNYYPWSEDLKDKDIFFIFLNFNVNSADKLFFSDDKIEDLLFSLKDNPKYSYLSEYITDGKISSIASQLGKLSNNNIGTIIDLISSKDFIILLETNKPFLDFYFSIKHGNYTEAQKKYKDLEKFNTVNIVDLPLKSKIMQYKLNYEGANLKHFLGEYYESYNDLNMLMAELINDKEIISTKLGESLYTDIVILQSHVKKHMGNFDEAAQILLNVSNSFQNISWMRSFFSICILQLNEYNNQSLEWHNLLNELDLKMSSFHNKRKIINSDYFFYEAYYPIVEFYKNNFKKEIIPNLIKIENKAIEFYEKEERRYLTNCYFIKAELYRINNKLNKAEEYYNHCFEICRQNGDKDILYLIAYTYKAVKLSKNYTLKIKFDWDKYLEECKQSEEYKFHQRLISKLEIATLNIENLNIWKDQYDKTINPIP